MNIEEFMLAVGTNRPSTISAYIKKGILQPAPIKLGKALDYVDIHVKQVLAYKATGVIPENPNAAKIGSDNADTSTIPTYKTSFTSEDVIVTQDKHDFNYNCYGEFVGEGAGDFNEASILRYINAPLHPSIDKDRKFYTVEELPAFMDTLFSKIGFKGGLRTVKYIFDSLKNPGTTDKLFLNVNYNYPNSSHPPKITDKTSPVDAVYLKEWNVPLYSYRQADAKAVARGFPSFEVYFSEVLRYLYIFNNDFKYHMDIMQTLINEGISKYQAKPVTLFDKPITYLDSTVKTFPPVYYKSAKPAIGLHKPRILTKDGTYYFDDSIEELRYNNPRNVIKYPFNDAALPVNWRKQACTADPVMFINWRHLEKKRLSDCQKFFDYYEIPNKNRCAIPTEAELQEKI